MNEQEKKTAIFVAVIVGGLLVAYITNQGIAFLKDTLAAVGIGEDSTDKEAGAAAKISKAGKNTPTSKAFEGQTLIDFVREKYPSYTYALNTSATAQKYAKDIYGAIGVLYDDPEIILATFKKLNTKIKVAQLVNEFRAKYNKDLNDWLQLKLDTDKQQLTYANIVSYVDNLPIGLFLKTDKNKKIVI